jgi:hypothetical protein
MAKLFVFGIGGTGARVIKSLAMLLASGVKSNFSEIVPIIIDPDRAGGDINRTVKILGEYQKIQKELTDFEHNHFFKTSILTLSEVISRKGANSNVIDGFKFEIGGAQNDRFKNFIDYPNLDPNNKWLTNLLFSDENLNSTLEVGFKGNPNIGSVVLNQFTKSNVFEAFARNFEQGDRIFIISSIFGGTGAAGFPLVMKNIREGFVNGENYDYLKNALIGAVTVQPYFKVSKKDESKIDSKGFVSKTKAALHYYFKNVTGNNSVNALYYIGDSVSAEYENNEGGVDQRNDAHFVELASALSIIDFSNIENGHMQTKDGVAVSPVYKEFGVSSVAERLTFNELFEGTINLVRSNITEFFYFNLFLKEKLQSALDHPYASAYANKFDKNFIDQSSFYKTLSDFNKSYRIWLGELFRNKISFAPFNIEIITSNSTSQEIIDIKINTSSIYSLVNGVREKKSWKHYVPGLSMKNYELFIDNLNKAAIKVGDTSTNKRFMGIFSKASKEVVNQKLF